MEQPAERERERVLGGGGAAATVVRTCLGTDFIEYVRVCARRMQTWSVDFALQNVMNRKITEKVPDEIPLKSGKYMYISAIFAVQSGLLLLIHIMIRRDSTWIWT